MSTARHRWPLHSAPSSLSGTTRRRRAPTLHTSPSPACRRTTPVTASTEHYSAARSDRQEYSVLPDRILYHKALSCHRGALSATPAPESRLEAERASRRETARLHTDGRRC